MSEPLDLNVNLHITASGWQEIKAQAEAAMKEINVAAATASGPSAVKGAYSELRSSVEQARVAAASSGSIFPAAEFEKLQRSLTLGEARGVRLAAPQAPLSSDAQELVARQERIRVIQKEVEALNERTAKTLAESDVETSVGLQWVNAKARNIEAEAIRNAVVQTAIAEEGALAAATGQTAAAKQKIAAEAKAVEEEALASDVRYVEANINAARAREEIAARQVLIASGDYAAAKELQGAELLAVAAVRERTQANLKSAAEINLVSREDAVAEIQSRAAKAAATRAQELQTRTLTKQLAAQGAVGADATLFQRLQAQFSNSGKTAPEFQTGGQFVGQKVLTTAAYGIAGAAVFGAAFGIAKLLKDAEELEQRFTRIREQLKGFGEDANFAKVKAQIIGIAEDTGQSMDKTGEAFQRFRGSFGNTDVALTATSDAMKLVTASGGDVNAVIEDSIAITKSFGVSVSQMGDELVDVADKSGVGLDSLQRFVGETAASAKEAGLSLRDTAILGAHAAQELGTAPEQNAGNFNRVINQIGQYKEQILSLYSATPALQKNLEVISTAFSKGETGTVLKQLIADFNQLNKPQQEGFIAQLGGRRTAPFLTGLLQDTGQLTQEFTAADQSAGKLNARFESIQDTLKNISQRVQQAFKELGDALLQAGIGDVLGDIGVALGVVVKSVTELIGLFHLLDHATQFVTNILSLGKVGSDFAPGVLSTFAQIAIVAALATKAINTTRTALGARAAKGVEEDAVAAGKNASAEASARKTEQLTLEEEALAANAAANVRVAGSEDVLASSKTTATGASEAETVVLDEASVAKVAEIAENARLAESESALAASRLEDATAAGVEGGATKASTGSKLFGGSIFKGGGATPSEGQGAGVAGLALAGAIVVGQKYEETRTDVGKEADETVKKIQKADKARLEKVLAQEKSNQDTWANIAFTVFGQENPLDSLQKQIDKLNAKPTSDLFSGLIKTNSLDKVVATYTDAQLNDFKNFINQAGDQSDELKRAYAEAGGKLSESGYDRLENAATEILPNATGLRSEGVVENAPTKEDLTKTIIPNLQKKLEQTGDQNVKRLLDKLNSYVQGNASLQQIIDDAIKRGDDAAAVAAAGGTAGFIGTTNAGAKAELETGKISLASYIEKVKRNNELGRKSAGTPEDVAAADKADLELQKVVETRVKNSIKNAQALAQVHGTSTSTQASVAELQAQINSPGVSEQTKINDVPDLLAKEQAQFEESLKLIVDPVARAEAAAKGFKLSPELRRELVARQIQDNDTESQSLTSLAAVLGVTFDRLNQEVSEDVVKTGKSVHEVKLDIIKRHIDELINQLSNSNITPDDRKAIYDELNRLQEQRNTIEGEAGTSVDNPDTLTPDQIKQIENNNNKQQATVARLQGDAALAKAAAGGDATAQARIALKELRDELAAAEANPNADPNQKKLLAAAIMDAERTLNQDLADDAASNLELAASMTRDPVQQAQIRVQIAQLKLETDRANGAGTKQLNADAIALNQAMQGAADAEEAAVASQLELLASATRDPAAQAQINVGIAQLKLATDIANGAGTKAVNDDAIALNKANQAAADAQEAIIESQLGLLASATRDPVAQAKINIDIANLKLQADIANGAGTKAINDDGIALNKAVQAAADAEEAVLEAQAALAGGVSRDPVHQAQTQINIAKLRLAAAVAKGDIAAIADAQLNLEKAEQAAQDAQNAIVSAQIDLTIAKTNDPVAIARANQQKADEAARTAEGEAAQIQAQIQRVQADKELAQAISGIYAAQANLAIAVATAAGDTVKAAQLGLSEAQRKLQEAISTGAGDAAVAEAQAAVVQQQAAVRDAQFNKQLGDIDFLAQIGQITTAQEVEMLQALANLPNLTEEQIRSIRLKIKELQNQLGQNFQFNLPTDLGLPTLYEARRTLQNGGTTTYVDNRQVQIILNPQTAADHAQVKQVITDVVSGRATILPGRQY